MGKASFLVRPHELQHTPKKAHSTKTSSPAPHSPPSSQAISSERRSPAIQHSTSRQSHPHHSRASTEDSDCITISWSSKPEGKRNRLQDPLLERNPAGLKKGTTNRRSSSYRSNPNTTSPSERTPTGRVSNQNNYRSPRYWSNELSTVTYTSNAALQERSKQLLLAHIEHTLSRCLKDVYLAEATTARLGYRWVCKDGYELAREYKKMGSSTMSVKHLSKMTRAEHEELEKALKEGRLWVEKVDYKEWLRKMQSEGLGAGRPRKRACDGEEVRLKAAKRMLKGTEWIEDDDELDEESNSEETDQESTDDETDSNYDSETSTLSPDSSPKTPEEPKQLPSNTPEARHDCYIRGRGARYKTTKEMLLKHINAKLVRKIALNDVHTARSKAKLCGYTWKMPDGRYKFPKQGFPGAVKRLIDFTKGEHEDLLRALKKGWVKAEGVKSGNRV
ncbi:hypothetical protein BJ508DRAFT_341115 [Ascobolus immersus RN42]|uniref:Uncharacterized protein n=1 Tax=Ascobolus immersus RN42 TaxID=1160509 RepID=A0A3N4ID91_ASCIM|nr:hypothetical protein BJ508DRAFT_341115 [Ascobolus immersus RN42]